MTSHSKLERHTGSTGSTGSGTVGHLCLVCFRHQVLSSPFNSILCVCVCLCQQLFCSVILKSSSKSTTPAKYFKFVGQHPANTAGHSFACSHIVFDRLLQIQHYVQIIERAHTHEWRPTATTTMTSMTESTNCKCITVGRSKWLAFFARVIVVPKDKASFLCHISMPSHFLSLGWKFILLFEWLNLIRSEKLKPWGVHNANTRQQQQQQQWNHW